MSDPVFSALIANVNRLGDELDAANDGALHHAYGARADMMVDVLNFRYRAAVAELSAYRRCITTVTTPDGYVFTRTDDGQRWTDGDLTYEQDEMDELLNGMVF